MLSPAPSVITSTSPALSPVSTLHLHNQLLTGLYANILRDPPPDAVAPWVVATDKPSDRKNAAAGSGANDKAEERLKREVMGLHARDRRRIKQAKNDPASAAATGGLAELQSYAEALAVKPPEITPASAGGLTKTNWDLEIRRRYAQPLAQETLEFPSQSDVQARIEPICYEEGLVGGSASLQACAELVEQATEVYLKELLGALCEHSRSNMENCIATKKFKRQLRREEEDAESGVVQRNPAGLLPVELEVQANRQPLDMQDLRLALHTGDSYIRQDRFLAELVQLNGFAEEQRMYTESNGFKALDAGSKAREELAAEKMAADEQDWGWSGGMKADNDALMGVLDDCLAVG